MARGIVHQASRQAKRNPSHGPLHKAKRPKERSVTKENKLLYSTPFAHPWGPSAWLRYYSTLYPMREPADFVAYTAQLKTNLAEPGRLEALQPMLFASKAASEERLTRVTAPALMLMGSKDPEK
jgi:hypothetical protein